MDVPTRAQASHRNDSQISSRSSIIIMAVPDTRGRARGIPSILQGFQKAGSNFLDLGTPHNNLDMGGHKNLVMVQPDTLATGIPVEVAPWQVHRRNWPNRSPSSKSCRIAGVQPFVLTS